MKYNPSFEEEIVLGRHMARFWCQHSRANMPFKASIRQFKLAIRQFKLSIRQFKYSIRQFKLPIRQLKCSIRQFKLSIRQLKYSIRQLKLSIRQLKQSIDIRQFKQSLRFTVLPIQKNPKHSSGMQFNAYCMYLGLYGNYLLTSMYTSCPL